MSFLSSIRRLLKPVVESDLFQTAIEFLEFQKVKTTDLEDSNDLLALARTTVRLTFDLAGSLVNVVASGFRSDAEDEWLDLHAEDFYELDRKPAESAEWSFTLTNNSGGVVDEDAGALIIRTDDDREFVNKNDLDIASPIGTAATGVVFVAREPGALGSASSSTWEWVTPLAGVEISALSATLTKGGQDKESDDQLRERCGDQWGTIDGGGVDEAYAAWALRASPAIRRVKVVQHTPGEGQVTIYVAGSTGPVTDDERDSAQDYIDKPDHAPGGVARQCVDVFVVHATVRTVVVTGTVYALPRERVAAKKRFLADIATFQSEFEMDGVVRLDRLIEIILSPLSRDKRGDNRVVLSAPTGDIDLAPSEILVLDTSGLNWVDA